MVRFCGLKPDLLLYKINIGDTKTDKLVSPYACLREQSREGLPDIHLAVDKPAHLLDANPLPLLDVVVVFVALQVAFPDWDDRIG